MIDLKTFLNESIVNEAKAKLYMLFSHDDPDTTYLVNVTDENAFLKIVKHTDLDYDSCDMPNNGLVYIEHSDESPAIDVVTGVSSPSQLASKVKQDVENVYKDLNEDDDYIEFELDYFPCYFELDKEEFGDAKKAYQGVIDYFEKSFIDGDSSAMRCIYDVKKQQKFWGPDYNIAYYEDQNEFLARYQDED